MTRRQTDGLSIVGVSFLMVKKVTDIESKNYLETAFLLRSPANRIALEESLAEAAAHSGIKVNHQKGRVRDQLLVITSQIKPNETNHSGKI